MHPAVRRLAFALALVLPGPVVGACVAVPPPPVAVASVGGTATIMATAGVAAPAARRLSANVPEYSIEDVSHVVLTLYTVDGATETQVAEVDVPAAYLANPATFAKLKANTAYRIKAKAYKDLGRGLDDQISDDPTSQVDVATTNEDRPTWAVVPVKLVAKWFYGTGSTNTYFEEGNVIQGLRGLVMTFAGTSSPGAANGQGPAASFNNPGQLADGPSGSILVVDGSNHKIRKLEPNGAVTNFAGTGTMGANENPAQFNAPSAISPGSGTMSYVADTMNHTIREYDSFDGTAYLAAGGPGVPGDQDGRYDQGPFSRLNAPRGVHYVGSGIQDTVWGVYVADTGNNKIRHFEPGVPGYPTTTVAGTGSPALTDGPGASAAFKGPRGITSDGQSFLYIADTGNHAIRRMRIDDLGTFQVETLAGDGTAGAADGPGATARFNNPASVAFDYSNNYLYVADALNNKIRRIDLNEPDFPVTTVAGSGAAGVVDGTGAGAGFHSPVGILLAPDGSLVVADRLGHRIRRVR